MVIRRSGLHWFTAAIRINIVLKNIIFSPGISPLKVSSFAIISILHAVDKSRWHVQTRLALRRLDKAWHRLSSDKTVLLAYLAMHIELDMQKVAGRFSTQQPLQQSVVWCGYCLAEDTKHYWLPVCANNLFSAIVWPYCRISALPICCHASLVWMPHRLIMKAVQFRACTRKLSNEEANRRGCSSHRISPAFNNNADVSISN